MIKKQQQETREEQQKEEYEYAKEKKSKSGKKKKQKKQHHSMHDFMKSLDDIFVVEDEDGDTMEMTHEDFKRMQRKFNASPPKRRR